MAEKQLTLRIKKEEDVLTIYGAVEYAKQEPISALWMAFMLGKTFKCVNYCHLTSNKGRVYELKVTGSGTRTAREIVEVFGPKPGGNNAGRKDTSKTS